MKPQTLIMLAVAGACGLAAMVLTQRFLTAPVDKSGENLTKVVVASAEIPGGQQITDTMVSLVDLDKNSLPANYIADPKKIIGRAARYPISAREIITDKKLAAEGISAGLEPVIGEGMRAVSVPITTEGGVAGFIKPDSVVDIMLIVPARSGKPSVAATILQNVKVLAVNSQMQQSVDGNTAQSDKGIVVENVTMLLSPDNSLKLALAQKNGTLQLMLRSRRDKEDHKQAMYSLDDVLAGRNPGDKPEEAPDAVLAEDTGVSDILNTMTKAEPAQAPQPAPVPEPEPVVQVPRKNLKRLVYRDMQGNPVMEVLVDADSKMGKTLEKEKLLESLPPSEADFEDEPVNQPAIDPRMNAPLGEKV